MNNQTRYTDVEYFEKMVLARVLKYPAQRRNLKLLPEHFADRRHGAIYEAITKDASVNSEKLLTAGVVEPGKYGDYDFLKTITDFDVVTENGIIADQKNIYALYRQREITKLSEGYLQHPVDDMARQLADAINTLDRFDIDGNDSKVDTLSEIWDDLHIDNDMALIKSNIDDLDRVIDGFAMGQLNVVAARPSMGKTAFAIALAIGLSKTSNVTLCSLEMSEKKLTHRILSSIAGVDAYKFKKPTERMTTEDVEKTIGAITDYHDMPINVEAGSRLTPHDIRTIANNADPDKPAFVIIDYLQLMSADGRAEGRREEVEKISRELKVIAQEFPNVCIIALAQLNRGVEGRQDKRPMMSDLRESGQIEQDADIIMILYRDDYYNRPDDIDPKAPSPLEVIVVKNRDGLLGTAHLEFYKNIQRIY